MLNMINVSPKHLLVHIIYNIYTIEPKMEDPQKPCKFTQ